MHLLSGLSPRELYRGRRGKKRKGGNRREERTRKGKKLTIRGLERGGWV